MNSFLDRLLSLYNLSLSSYEEMTKDVKDLELEDYHNFINIDIAEKRIKEAISKNEKIMIYGDYDCDGITSTSILVYTFKRLGYDNIGYYIPSRYLDGYGINEKMVEAIHNKGYSLIITVDNGVAQFDALKKAKEYNIDVILTDHHEIKEELPICYTIIHPFLKNDGSSLAQCGAYVAFNLSRALLNETDDYLLTLASLATISDMMPLVSHNRNIVRIGLDKAKNGDYLPFKLLLNNEEINDEKSFSFVCAPKINSLGRVLENTNVNKGVEFFVNKDDEMNVAEIARLIEFTNNKRKVISNEAAMNIDYSKYSDKSFVVDYLKDIQEGLIGLVANKVINEINKPVVIFTKDHKSGLLKGSARSLEGLPLNEIFSKMSDLIVQFGGHAQAGGLAIEENKLDEFISRINILANDYTPIPKKKLIIDCKMEDFTYENYEIIRSLAPYGVGFEEPYLSLIYPCKNINYLKGFQHIKGTINFGCSFIGFNTNKDYGRSGNVKLIGHLALDSFRGNKFLSFNVIEVELINN